MWLFAGLGNPGAQYAGNRHNIGFMAVDAIAVACRAPAWRSRFQGLASEAMLGADRVLLLKPATYMNESGRAIGEAARFYRIEPAHVVVFHDELDLAAGTLRVKTGGGNAGHNGLRSASAVIGNDYVRVRLGIGHPGDKALVHSYVLSDFARDERDWVSDICAAVADHAPLLLAGDPAGFQGRIMAGMAAKGHVPKVDGPKDTAGARRIGGTDTAS